MLIYRRTNILESTAQTLVNTVNCVGVMGKGIAKEYKLRYPEMFRKYQDICRKELLQPGKLWIWQGPDHLVLNFPTKLHWRSPSRLEWIDHGLAKFADSYEKLGIKEISFPRLGCGNGGLNWDDVRPLMERHLAKLPIQIYIHDYAKDIGLPEHLEPVAEQLKEKMTRDDSFSTFVESLECLVHLSGGALVELGSSCEFEAAIDSEELRISSRVGDWKFQTDDLLAIWYRLRKGLVTEADAEADVQLAIGGGGKALVSLLSLLPCARPVEIQRGHAGHPEIAVEMRPPAALSAVESPRQEHRQLAWH